MKDTFLIIKQITSGPYGNLEMTSGAIQYGVPTNDFLLGNCEVTCAQNPKSDNLTCEKK
jgi:hypothetical protein